MFPGRYDLPIVTLLVLLCSSISECSDLKNDTTVNGAVGREKKDNDKDSFNITLNVERTPHELLPSASAKVNVFSPGIYYPSERMRRIMKSQVDDFRAPQGNPKLKKQQMERRIDDQEDSPERSSSISNEESEEDPPSFKKEPFSRRYDDFDFDTFSDLDFDFDPSFFSGSVEDYSSPAPTYDEYEASVQDYSDQEDYDYESDNRRQLKNNSPKPNPKASSKTSTTPKTTYNKKKGKDVDRQSSKTAPQKVSPRNGKDDEESWTKTCYKTKKFMKESPNKSKYPKKMMTCYFCVDGMTGEKVEKCSYNSEPVSRSYVSKSGGKPGGRNKRAISDYKKSERRYDKNYRFGPEHFKEKSFRVDKDVDSNETCKRYRKGDNVCISCKNEETGGSYEQCSYVSKPKQDSYQRTKKTEYRKKGPERGYEEDDSGESIEEDETGEYSEEDSEESGARSRHEAEPTQKAPFSGKMSSRYSRPPSSDESYVASSESYESPKPSPSKSGRNQNINPDPMGYIRGKKNRMEKPLGYGFKGRTVHRKRALYGGSGPRRSRGYEYDGSQEDSGGSSTDYSSEDRPQGQPFENYFSKMFPNFGQGKFDSSGEYGDYSASSETSAEESGRPPPKYEGSSTPRSRKTVKVVGEADGKNRTNCKKIVRGLTTCYQCPDEKRVLHEECLYFLRGGATEERNKVHNVQKEKQNSTGGQKADEKNRKRVEPASTQYLITNKPTVKQEQTPSPYLTTPKLGHTPPPSRIKRMVFYPKLEEDYSSYVTEGYRDLNPASLADDFEDDIPSLGLNPEPIGPPPLVQPRGIFSSHTDPVYHDDYKFTLPRFMVDKTHDELDFDHVVSMGY